MRKSPIITSCISLLLVALVFVQGCNAAENWQNLITFNGAFDQTTEAFLLPTPQHSRVISENVTSYTLIVQYDSAQTTSLTPLTATPAATSTPTLSPTQQPTTSPLDLDSHPILTSENINILFIIAGVIIVVAVAILLWKVDLRKSEHFCHLAL